MLSFDSKILAPDNVPLHTYDHQTIANEYR